MDAFKNCLKLKPSHIIGNDMGGENINSFGLVKFSVGYLFDSHKNQIPMKTFNLGTISYTQFTPPSVPPPSKSWVA
jgi:hypothetical protein